MQIWWETSFWHRVTPPVKNPGYAPDTYWYAYHEAKGGWVGWEKSLKEKVTPKSVFVLPPPSLY